MDNKFLKKISDLDQIVITQKLRSDTAVNDKLKHTTMARDGEICFSFSLLKGIIALIGGMAAVVAMVFAFKKSVEKKLLNRLEKEYFLVPISDCAKEDTEE